MIFRTLLLLAPLARNISAQPQSPDDGERILDLEVIVDGERKLFPLLPGTQCPAGHTCLARPTVRTAGSGAAAPMASALKYTLKSPRTKTLAAKLDWHGLNDELVTVVKSDDYCTRRNAMAKAAGLATGVMLSTVNAPAYAAETAIVSLGSVDGKKLVFAPDNTKICSGDSVRWIKNIGKSKHNIIFDREGIPRGASAKALTQTDLLREEGDTFERKFVKRGTYNYYCEPHKTSGMLAKIVVV